MGHCKVSQQKQGSDPEDKGDDGVLQQGHHGEGLQELEVRNLVWFYFWRQILEDQIILNMYLCKFIFSSIKSDDFQLCCAILK